MSNKTIEKLFAYFKPTIPVTSKRLKEYLINRNELFRLIYFKLKNSQKFRLFNLLLIRRVSTFDNNNSNENCGSNYNRTKWNYYEKYFKRYLTLTSTSYLLAATSCIYSKFKWDDYRIKNEELRNYINEALNQFEEIKGINLNDGSTVSASSAEIKDNNNPLANGNPWIMIFKQKDSIIWRRVLVENDQPTGIYEYKVYGRLNDITPLDFYRTQIDLDYRKKWDHLCIKAQVLSQDKKYLNQTSELIQWIMKFPFPMNSREYIFVRRYCIEPNKRLLVLLSKSVSNPNIDFNFGKLDSVDDEADEEDTIKVINHPVEHPKAVSTSSNSSSKSSILKYEQPHNQAPYVRVTKYESNMIIRPHTDFNELGLDYILQYHDNPKARIPNVAYKWMAASGLPDWLEKLHKAALNIPKSEVNLSRFEKFYLNEDNTQTSDNKANTVDTTQEISTTIVTTEVNSNNSTDTNTHSNEDENPNSKDYWKYDKHHFYHHHNYFDPSFI